MTIPRNIVQSVAAIYTVCVLALSADAFLPLLISGNDPTDVSKGAPAMRAAWALVYVITLVSLSRRQNQVFRLIRANKPLLFLVLLPFVSVLWSIERSSTLHAAVILSLSALFAMDMSVRYTFVRQLQLLCVALALLIGMSVFLELVVPGLVPRAEFEGAAWHGVFANKNQLGRMADLGVAAYLAVPRQSRWAKGLAIASGVLVGVLAQSASAVGYLLVIVGLFMWFAILKWGPKQRKIAIGASTMIAFLMVYAISQNMVKATAAIGKDPTLTRRTDLWRLSLTAVEEHPLLGYGYAAFWGKTSQPARPIRQELSWDAPHSHNGYIELLLGLGLAGLGAYAVVFWTMAGRAYVLFMNGQESYRKWPLIYLTFVSIYQLTESGVVSGDTIVWIVFCCLALSLPQVSRDRVALPSMVRREFAS